MLLTLLGSRVRVANQDFAEEFINFARQQKLYVCWLGIQPTPIIPLGVKHRLSQPVTLCIKD
jgi:hypothetical protein